jgi:hypothetical protein
LPQLGCLVFDEVQIGGLVSFEAFARVLSLLQKGTATERLLFCLSLFKQEPGSVVDASGTMAAIRALFALYGCVLEHKELQKIASTVTPGCFFLSFFLSFFFPQKIGNFILRLNLDSRQHTNIFHF